MKKTLESTNSGKAEVDYKKLLEKYVLMVRSEEGYDYIYNHCRSNVDWNYKATFSEEEWEALLEFHEDM